MEGHWVEGALNGYTPTGAVSKLPVVDYTFFSEELVNGRPVIQEVIVSPPGYGFSVSDRIEAVLTNPGRGIPPDNCAYSAAELREKLESRGIPLLQELKEAMER